MQNAALQLIIFDFDGTLADSFPWFTRVLNDVADRYRFRRIEPHEVELLRGLSGREVMRHLRASPWKVPFIAAHMRRLKARDIDQVSLFDGVPAMLRQLSDAGFTLAIVSSNALENVRHVLGEENAALIRHYECGVSIFGKKSRFLKLLKATSVAPAAALSIGDEIRDAEASRAAGIPFGAVSWGYTTPAALVTQKPAIMFSSMAEIAALAQRDDVQPGRTAH
jgi:phosphoglycolate phosphatase